MPMKAALTPTWVVTPGIVNAIPLFYARRLAHNRARAALRNCEQFVNFFLQNYEPFISNLLPVKELF